MPASDGQVTVQYRELKGFCMEPALLYDDRLVVDTALQGYRVGDILVYHAVNHSDLMAHRMIGRTNDGRFVISSDAEPLTRETIAQDQILGRVISVLRAGRKIHLSPSGVTPVVIFLSYGASMAFVRMKDLAARILLPLIERIQALSWYGKWAKKMWVAEIKKTAVGGVTQLNALVGGRRAGGLYFEVVEVNGERVIWVAQLFVRIRYRGAGIAARLVEEISGEAMRLGIQRCHLACRNDVAGFYRRLGFREMEPPSPFYQHWDRLGRRVPGDLLMEKRWIS